MAKLKKALKEFTVSIHNTALLSGVYAPIPGASPFVRAVYTFFSATNLLGCWKSTSCAIGIGLAVVAGKPFFFATDKMTRIAAWVIGFTIGGCLVHLGGYFWERSLAPAVSSSFPEVARSVSANDRFVVLANWNNEAVYDRKTKLIWERSPNRSFSNWSGAQDRCQKLVLGKRGGWRLPTIFELATLVDPNVPSPGPTLPAGHPFVVVPSFYWSATSDITNDSNAWGVGFNVGDVGSGVKTAIDYVWCVRDSEGMDMTPL